MKKWLLPAAAALALAGGAAMAQPYGYYDAPGYSDDHGSYDRGYRDRDHDRWERYEHRRDYWRWRRHHDYSSRQDYRPYDYGHYR